MTVDNTVARGSGTWWRSRRPRLSRPGRGVLATVLAATIVVTGPVVAAPPAAAIEGLRNVIGSSSQDSSTFKSLTLNCPTGTHGLGGDLRIVGNSQIRIHAIFPSSTSVYFAATEPEEGFAGTWSFNARAICAPTASLPGLKYVTDTQRADVLARGAPVTVQAVGRCLGRTGAIGIGARVTAVDSLTGSDPTSKVRLNAISTIGSLDGSGDLGQGVVTASGFEGSVLATAVAVCVSDDLVPSLVWDSTELPFDSTDDKQAAVACPAGTKLHGGGFLINWQTIDLTGAHVGVTALRFNADVQAVARESVAGTPKDWSLYAIIICA